MATTWGPEPWGWQERQAEAEAGGGGAGEPARCRCGGLGESSPGGEALAVRFPGGVF